MCVPAAHLDCAFSAFFATMVPKVPENRVRQRNLQGLPFSLSSLLQQTAITMRIFILCLKRTSSNRKRVRGCCDHTQTSVDVVAHTHKMSNLLLWSHTKRPYVDGFAHKIQRQDGLLV